MGEDELADNRRQFRDGHAAGGCHQLRQLAQTPRIGADSPSPRDQPDGHLLQTRVARAISQPIDGDVEALCPAERRRQRIGCRQTEIVVAVKVNRGRDAACEPRNQGFDRERVGAAVRIVDRHACRASVDRGCRDLHEERRIHLRRMREADADGRERRLDERESLEQRCDLGAWLPRIPLRGERHQEIEPIEMALHGCDLSRAVSTRGVDQPGRLDPDATLTQAPRDAEAVGDACGRDDLGSRMPAAASIVVMRTA